MRSSVTLSKPALSGIIEPGTPKLYVVVARPGQQAIDAIRTQYATINDIEGRAWLIAQSLEHLI